MQQASTMRRLLINFGQSTSGGECVSAMERSLFLVYIFLCTLTWVIGQEGKDCKTDKECKEHQTCQFGYCVCNSGYVKNKRHCFKILKHGQVCYFEEQCQDYRMNCEARDSQELMRCHCDRYHEWSESLQECIHAQNITEIIQSLQGETQWSDELALRGKRVFYWLVVAGLTVVSIGLVCVAVGFSYACCCREKRSHYDDTEKLRVQEVASVGSPEGSYVPIITDVTIGRPGTSGTTG